MLQSMGLQRIGHDLGNNNWKERVKKIDSIQKWLCEIEIAEKGVTEVGLRLVL